MAGTEKAKRRWGKSRHREKITIVDRMEIEDSLQKFAEEVKSFKDRHEVAATPHNNHQLDLQQPELMSDFSLVEALRKIKVPIPVYADGSPSRERLLYLFRQHVMPRPQRTKHGRRQLRRRMLKRAGGGEESSSQSCNVEEAELLDDMEVDATDDHWALGEDGSWLFPMQRKRKNEVAPSTSVGAPPEKKVSQNTFSQSQQSQGSKSLADNVQAVVNARSGRKIIKLKRPVKSVPTT